jgi:putative SOS response-associated peptidase YedK
VGADPLLGEGRDRRTQPINAKAETLASLPTFRDAYKRRHSAGRQLLRVESDQRAEDQAALCVRDEVRRAVRVGCDLGELELPHTEEWMRTFCIITTTANELVSTIHDRMPVILLAETYDRWLANIEPDPRDLLAPFPWELMKIWPISTRVNKA